MSKNTYTILALVIMFIVTLIPRVLPITIFRKKIESPFINSFLYYVPYAVLISMAIPAIFTALDNLNISIVITVIATVLGLLKQKLFVICGICIVVAYALTFVM